MGSVTNFFDTATGGLLGGKGHSVEAQSRQVDRSKFEIEGAEEDRKRAQQLSRDAEGRSQFANVANADLIRRLQDQVSGKAPSLAEAQMKSATDRSLSQQLAAMQSTRPQNQALSARQAMRSAAGQQQGIAQASGVARLQEQRGAQDLLASTLGQEQALADSLTQSYLQQGFDISKAQMMGRSQAETLQNQNFMQRQEMLAQAQMAKDLRAQQQHQSFEDMAGMGAMMSDKRQKKQVKNADKEVDNFLKAISAKEYKYKDTKKAGTSKGTNYGVMAQALEKSKMGKSMIANDSEGNKMVDMKKGFSAVLAAQSRLAHRLEELEKRKKKNG